MYAKAKITSKYQITLPKDIRKRLDLKRGDEVIFEDKDHEVIVKTEKKMDPVESIVGILEGENLQKLKSKAASRLLARKLGL